MADRGYDADKTVAYIEQEMGASATIPPRKHRVAPRACDYAAYRERHLVECFIRVFSRFDKYATRFLAFVRFASTAIWRK